jgi:hypothetical protein
MSQKALVCIVLVLIMLATARAAEVQQKPAADVPELEPLGNYVGVWVTEATIKNSDHPEGIPSKGTATAEWIHNGRYVRQTWSVEASNDLPSFNGSSIYTYDAQKKAYRCWGFDSNGISSEGEGTWDPKTRTFKWTVKQNFFGGTSTTTSTTAKDGEETWSIVIKDNSGKVAIDVAGKNTRREK